MPVRLRLTAGPTADCTQAGILIDGLSAEHLLADRGYDSDAIVEQATNQGMQVVIPPRKNRKIPRAYEAALYRHRHLVEDAFAIAKRLLGLAYFYGGAQNAVELQLWATWILYAVLVDLTDAVAEALRRPFAEISMEMVYRSLYFVVAAQHQDPTLDPVRYLAEQAKPLGLIKRPRKPPKQKAQAPLDSA